MIDNPSFSINEVARALEFEKYKVQRIIDQLKAAKLVAQDRPGGHYHVTEKGKKIVYGVHSS